MAVLVEKKGQTIFISLSGKLDFSEQDEIHAVVENVLADKSAPQIRVDLGKVTFMDSSVIQSLLSLQVKASKNRQNMILVNCPEAIKEIFSIGGFDSIFNIQ